MADAHIPDETVSFPKMDAELKAKWLGALRSGDYEQGQAELCSETSFGVEHCCLGVLAEVAGTPRDVLYGKQHLGDIARDSLLGPWSLEGADEYDLEDEDTHCTAQRKLAAMNDGGSDFEDIADWIEVNL